MNVQYGSKKSISHRPSNRNTYGAATLVASEAITSACAVARRSNRGYPSIKRDGAPQYRKPQLLYQPQIDIHNGWIAGTEARIHWDRNGKGIPAGGAPTSQLGCLAMEKAMSEWAVRKVCLQASMMNREGLPAVRTTIRFSAQQLMDPRLDGFLRESISDAAIRPELIECGISESTLLENHQTLAPVMRKLADTGVRIAVSDFGSDRSALCYPKQFPVNAIWIDHSFFWRFASEAGAKEIVASVLAMATRQGLTMVVCGVHNLKQMMMLYQEGCRIMQGNFLGHPLPLDVLKTVLREVGSAWRQAPPEYLPAWQ